MSLFPFVEVEESIEETSASPVREYEINFKTGEMTGRIVEGVDAVAVWAYLALSARRYRWEIYSWYYGSEYRNLIGQSYSEEYLNSEVQRYIEECLFENEHITGVEDLVATFVKDTLTATFTLVTEYGRKEVTV